MTDVTRLEERVQRALAESNALIVQVWRFCQLVDAMGAELEGLGDDGWAEVAGATGMDVLWNRRLYLAGLLLADSGRPAPEFMEAMAGTVSSTS